MDTISYTRHIINAQSVKQKNITIIYLENSIGDILGLNDQLDSSAS